MDFQARSWLAMALATGVCVGMAMRRAPALPVPPGLPAPPARPRRLVGILGGLGPGASALLLKLIVEEATRAGAAHDHEHPSVIVYVKPELPNSRLCVMGRGYSPMGGMVSALRVLRDAGATECCCACVTAHHFFRQAARTAGAPLLDLLAVTATKAIALLAKVDDKAEANNTIFLRIGLLSTDATVKSQLFQRAIADAARQHWGTGAGEDEAAQTLRRVEVVVPKDVSICQSCILSIKAGRAREDAVGSRLHAEAIKLVQEQGAQLIITGSTELPLGFSQVTHPDFPVPVLDPMRLLAKEIVFRHNARCRHTAEISKYQ